MHAFSATIDVSSAYLAGETSGAYDGPREGQPSDRVLAVLDKLEAARRELLDAWREVAEWGGLPGTSGWTGDEFLTLVGRLSAREARRLERMTSRLTALPVTAGLLARGAITVDQAATICEGSTKLSGTALAAVDAEAGRLAAERNERGDAPDVGDEVAELVDRYRRPKEIERAERRAVKGSRVIGQHDLDGGGWLYSELDAEAFPIVWGAIEDAAGPPSPDVPRSNQRAEGIVAVGRHWLAGQAGGAASPTTAVRVHVDIADATPGSFAQLVRVATGGRAPLLSARLLDTLTCGADVLLQVNDGKRPLIEIKDQKSLPAATRRMALARDRGCRWPGCSAPPWQCDVHHIRPRAEGGDHDPDNVIVLCRQHHRRTHSVHWTITLDPTSGALSWSRRRDGSNPLHTTYPHGTRPPPVPAPR